MEMASCLASAGPSLFTYFADSNLAGKLIVVALFGFSLLAWTVMVGKYMDLRSLRQANLVLQRKLSQESSSVNPDPRLLKYKGPYASLLAAAVGAYHRHQGAETAAKISFMENALQRTVAEATMQYESNMVLLGSIVTGAPFMGLLGTVWGVMDAFGGIGSGGTASIQSLAPGVSGALLTTVAGLLVAIPSVFGYNFLLANTKIMITELENFASALADRLEIEALEHQQGHPLQHKSPFKHQE